MSSTIRDNVPNSAGDKPLLTIVIIALNEERRLPLALRSIDDELKKNKDINIEIILVDNGSSDRTLKIMKFFKKTHHNVSVYKDPDILGSAYNRAIQHARGEYVLFLDADMRLPKNCLSRVLKLLREHPECDAIVAKIIPQYRYIGNLTRINIAYFLGDTGKAGFWPEPTFHSGGLIVKTVIAKKIAFRPLPTAYDGDFSYRFLEAGYKACYFPKEYFVFDEQYYDIKTAFSYFRKLGISLVILFNLLRTFKMFKTMLKTLLEPLTPHYIVIRRKKASRHIKVSFSEWILLGIIRLLAMSIAVIYHGVLGVKPRKKVVRLKY